MLLDWPSQKRELWEALQQGLLRQSLENSPVVAQVPRLVMHEGDSVVFVRPDGSRSETKLERHEVSSQFDREQVMRGGGQHIGEVVVRLGSELGRQMETHLFEKLKQVAPTTGSVIRGEGAEELAESLLEGLRSMRVEFDDEGQPQIVLSLSRRQMELLSQLETSELREKMDLILREKHDEWLRRESHRRLAD